jgi:hypothetical protein
VKEGRIVQAEVSVAGSQNAKGLRNLGNRGMGVEGWLVPLQGYDDEKTWVPLGKGTNNGR